ncbi:response regulator [Metasolibacillus meyeri]|uniref:Circadian input-output histidine kinase CikA n=1 Tax=Metasolibacillus meyeri TaxID=1071052 RepID=A0AAW9NNL6_9BACL|nr:response regulator [Metasolibacillus meyeri]MEC1179132.1 response regulator [Metasolibacillus meyeri]
MEHMHGSHDTLLVIFSYIVAVAASYTVLDLVGRISNLKGKSRLLWLLFGASAMGMGIWSMHFVAMLAFSLPVPVPYNIVIVIVSVIAAVIGSFFALHLVGRNDRLTLPRLLSAGILLATGIVAMHYIGMEAMQIGISYNYACVLLSVIIAILASIVALWLAFFFKSGAGAMKIYAKLGSGLVMGAAIAGMHYVGMYAAEFYVDESMKYSTGVVFNQQFLGYFISAGTLFSLTISLLGIYLVNKISFKDWEIEEKTKEIYKMNEELKELNSNLELLVKERTAQLEQAHDEAIKANMVKSKFLANMSHELRTPLNAIIGYSEMLAEEAEEIGEPLFVDDLNKIRNAGRHLLALINDILDISKIEAGKMEVHFEKVSIQQLIQDVIATIKPLVDQNNNALITSISDGEMTTDVTKLRQILINLISNGSKFTKDGTVTLTVAEEVRESQAGFSFRIQDTGIGMTPEQVEKLFQPFTQADASTTRKYGGTGLGLAISQSFSEMLGGEISVESKMDVGSTFTCWLPIAKEELPVSNKEEVQKYEQKSKVNILHIDDDPLNHKLMKHYLANEYWTLAYASSGQEGLEMAKQLQPEVICLDILMPSMDGWSVLNALKNDEELQHIPVIIWSMVKDEPLGYSLGASEYLTKPINKESLVSTFERYMTDQQQLKVLVVEDDATTSELMTKLLNKEGYAVTQAHNGQHAIDCVKGERPQLILLDLMMPEMDGFQFINELRATAEWCDIPVVVVTAKTLTGEEHLKLSSYVESIVQKGMFKHKTLLEKIGQILTKE